MCLLTNERYETYQTGFLFGHLSHAPGVGLGGTVGGGGLSGQKKNSEIQPDLVCELLTSMAHVTARFFWFPPPGALGGAKRSNIIKSQSQSQFPRFFKPNFVCLLTNERYKTIRRDFHSIASVMPHGWDLGVPWGTGGPKSFSPKFNQIWCGSYLHEWHMQHHNFLVPASWGLGEGPKGQISLNLNYKVNFKDF